MSFAEEDVSRFLLEFEAITQKKPALSPEDLVDTLAFPVPEPVQAYLSGAKKTSYYRVSSLPCQLRCQKCSQLISSEWLSRSAMKQVNTELPFKLKACDACQKKKREEERNSFALKWQPLIKEINQETEKAGPTPLAFFAHKYIAETVFNNQLDFQDYSWTIRTNFRALLPLIQFRLLFLSLDESGLTVSFHPDFELVPLSPEEHSFALRHWALSHINSVGEQVCRRSLEMSEKYKEDLTTLIKKSSYFSIAYAVFRAKKNAIAMSEIEGRRRDVTFKHTLRNTLEKVQAGEWKVPSGANFLAERDVPDEFWQLVRVRKHDLDSSTVLSLPLGDLAFAIEGGT